MPPPGRHRHTRCVSKVSDFLNSAEPYKGPYRCPDCNASNENGPAQHDSTCWVSRGVEEACDGDRQRFLEEPGLDAFVRPATRAEIIEFTMMGETRPVVSVEVTRLEGRPGLRSRRPIVVL